MTKNDPVTFEYVKAIFGVDSTPEAYDTETAELLDRAGAIFQQYREKAATKEFMSPDEIQKMIRTLTSIVCCLTPRLGYYDAEEMKTFWNKNLIRVTKRTDLYKKKTEKKLTEQMVATMSDTDSDYTDAVNEHLLKADFANRLKLVIRSAKIMLNSLQSELINLQSERKYTQK